MSSLEDRIKTLEYERGKMLAIGHALIDTAEQTTGLTGVFNDRTGEYFRWRDVYNAFYIDPDTRDFMCSSYE